MIEKLADGEAPIIDCVVDALWDKHDQVDITIDDAEDYGKGVAKALGIAFSEVK